MVEEKCFLVDVRGRAHSQRVLTEPGHKRRGGEDRREERASTQREGLRTRSEQREHVSKMAGSCRNQKLGEGLERTGAGGEVRSAGRSHRY